MKKMMTGLLGVLLAAALAACGGGGGNAGSTGSSGSGGSGTGSGGTSASAQVASVDFQLDKNAMSNSGSDDATLTVIALDSANNPVPGAALSVVADSGIYTPIVATTDSSGKASGKLSTGSNKSNRNIGFVLTVGSQTAKGVLPVTGSQITLSAVPAAPAPGDKVSLSIKVTDINNAGIANANVSLGGTLGFTGSAKTDSNGVATAVLAAAPAAIGNYTVDVTAAGVTSRRDVQVVSASGGIPAAVGVISAASLSVAPNTIAPNASGSSANRAGVKALFQDASNQALKNVRVRFEILAPGLGAGESISTGDAVVYTDANGVANADYIAGTRSSPTNGVVIRACYGNADTDVVNGACTNSLLATLTVAAQPVSITLGTNNEMAKGGDNLTYIKKFDVAVADSAGNAVSGAQISASVDLLRYGKGTFSGSRVFCPNEDVNRNGVLDAGEDTNGDQVLTPRKADIIISYVGSRTTGTNGRATIQIEYPQNVATWLDYAVKVTTNVSGSEGTVQRVFTTGFIDGDQTNGSFLRSPYGLDVSSAACRVPN